MVVRGKADPFLVACKELEKDLDRLKASYEMYFQGRERRPPNRMRDRFDRRIRDLRKELPNNTMMRFRIQSLWSRYTSMKSYWGRITRQIEEGTYKRHIQKARRRRQRIEKKVEEKPAALEIDVDLDAFDLDAEVGAALDALQDDKTEPNISVAAIAPTPPTPKPAAKPPSSGGIKTFGRPESASFPPQRPPVRKPAAALPKKKPPPPPRGDVDVKAVYDKYIEARKRNKERTDNVKLETLEKQIRKMVPKLKKKHAGKKIDFEVVVKNGKVGLKPVAKD